MTTEQPAAITGIGMVTPAGIGRSANWTRVCSGEPTTKTLPRLEGSPVDFANVTPDAFNPDRLVGHRVSNKYDRCTQLALVAARAALSDARLHPSMRKGARVGVVVGTSMGGTETMENNHSRLMSRGPSGVSATFLPKALVNMASGVLSIELGATGPNLVVSTACASGTTAIGVGLGLLRGGMCDLVVCGGTEASITPLHMAGFAKLRALSPGEAHPPAASSRPFDIDHDGFVMAEGAAMVTLEREADASARQVSPHARLAGYGATADAHHVTAPNPLGEGAQAAMRAACADDGLAPSEIDHVNAHATSTPLGDAAEARAISEIAPEAVVTSTKGPRGTRSVRPGRWRPPTPRWRCGVRLCRRSRT